MEITKIKTIKHDFYEGAGPAKTTSLGIMTDKVSVMFGTFYFGPGMTNEQSVAYDETEKLIDSIIANNESFGG